MGGLVDEALDRVSAALPGAVRGSVEGYECTFEAYSQHGSFAAGDVARTEHGPVQLHWLHSDSFVDQGDLERMREWRDRVLPLQVSDAVRAIVQTIDDRAGGRLVVFCAPEAARVVKSRGIVIGVTAEPAPHRVKGNEFVRVDLGVLFGIVDAEMLGASR